MIFTGPIYIHGFQKNGRPATLRERLDMRKSCGPYLWTPAVPGHGRAFYQSSEGLDIGDATFSLRLDYANTHLPYTRRYAGVPGFYADDERDTLYTPIIARLPHGRGFLAGWTMGTGMLASLDGRIHTDIEDAARAAFEDAEDSAEREREYQARACPTCYEQPGDCQCPIDSTEDGENS